MTGRLIGEAYISLLADASMFPADAKAKVDAALKGIKGDIPITGNTKDIDAKIAAVAAALKEFNGEVRIEADTRAFIRDIASAEAAVLGLMERLDHIPMDADNSKFMSKIFGAKSVVNGLAEQLENMDADGDMDKLLSKIYGASAVVEGLETEMSHLDADMDASKMQAKLGVLGAQVKDLAGELDHLRMDVTDSALLAKIAAAQAVVVKLAKSMRNLPLSADTLPLESDIYKSMAQVEVLKKMAASITVGATYDKGFIAKLPSFQQPEVYTTSEAQYLDELATKTLDAMMATRSLNMQLVDTAPVSNLAAAGLARLAASQSMIISKGTGFWGAWQNQIRLFGGALDSVLPKWARAVSMWHIAADVIFEFAAAWVPALIAVGVFAAYAFPVGEKIYDQWKNINTILDGVGGHLYDLGTSFDTVENAIEPSILIAFGEYMQVIGKNASPMAQALTGVGKVVDAWGANLVSWAAKAQKSLDNIIHSGSKDFALIGYGFEQLFRIVGEIIKDMPGIVHVLLPVGDAFLKFTADTVQVLGPVLKFGLLLHGVLVYAGLAATAVIALGRAISVAALSTFFSKTEGLAAAGGEAEAASGKFNKLGTAIGSFAGGLAAYGTNTARYGKSLFAVSDEAANVGVKTRIASAGSKLFADAIKLVPLGAFGLAAAGAAAVIGVGLYLAIKHTTDATVVLGQKLQALIAGSNASNIGKNLNFAIAQTQKQINLSLQGGTSAQQQYNKAVSGIPVNVSQAQANSVKNILKQQEQLNSAQQSGYTAAQKANPTSVYQQLTAIQQKAIGAAQNYGQRMSDLTGIFGSNGAALSALNLIGVSAGKVASETDAQWASQLIELKGLAAGYGYMGQNAGAAGAQLATLNITSGTTYKNIQALTQAETAWIALVTGGESAFTTFEQGFTGLNNAMSGTAKNAPTVSVTVGKINEKFSALGGTMKGTSASSLAVRQAFDQQLTAGTTLFGNLQMLAGASGNTAAAQGQLGKAGKDIIAQLLPFAAGSKQATAEVSALAQIMGGPATTNFQTLAKWVGHTKGAEADLNTEQAKLTISSSNVSKAAKALGNAILTDVTNMEAAKVATADLSSAISGLASNANKTHDAVNNAAVNFSGEYVSALKKAGLSTKDAESYLNAYLRQLGYTPAQISAIDSQLGDSVGQWNKYDKSVIANTKAAQANAKATTSNYEAFQALYGILPGSTAQLDAVWKATLKQDSAMVQSGKDTTGAKSQFVDFANNALGLTTSKAGELWKKFGNQNLDTLAAKATSTEGQFINFAENGLHVTAEKAGALWSEFAMQNLDMLITKGISAKGKFVDLAMNGLGLTKAKANDLWGTLRNQYLDALAGKAGETTKAFEGTAHQLGLTKAAADKLYASMHTLAAGSPYNTTVNDTISGQGGVVAKANIPGQPQLSARLNFSAAAHGLARGGLVSGGIHGQDSVPAILAPGELVVPSSHAPAFGAMAKQAGIPGLAGGGFIGAANSQAGTIGQINPFTASQGAQFSAEATAAFASMFSKSVTNSLNQQSAGLGGKYGGPSSFGGGFESLPALLSYAKYFMANGLNAAAAAGMAATISGEEDSAGPESVGSGGFGLIGWTGNTVGLPPGYHGPTGNVAFDLQQQLAGVIGYMNSRGGRGPLNAAGNPVAAGDVWSSYEAPAVRFSDTRPAIANEIYAALMGGSAQAGVKAAAQQAQTAGKLGQVRQHSAGGMVNEPVYGIGASSGLPYSFAERGSEYVGPLSGNQGTGTSVMQPMTNIQGQQANNQLATITKLLQQLPTTLGKAIAQGSGNGVRHGYYKGQN